MSVSAAFAPLHSVVTGLAAPPVGEWTRFQDLFRVQALEKNACFVRAGEPSTAMCFVNSGLLRFYYQTADGKEFNKAFSRENEFAAAYSAYLTDAPARFSIQALEPCQLLVAELREVVALFEAHRCWERFGRLVAEQLYIKKERREAEFLLDDASTRYRAFQAQHPGLESRLTQYHVASYLGITPVALSRLRKKPQRLIRGG